MKNWRARMFYLSVVGFALIVLGAGSAMASGFAIIEQSASGAGYAYAGAAAVAEDSSTIFFNPAGMAKLSHNELQIGAHYILVKSDFDNQGSSTVLGTPLNGPNSDGGTTPLVPNLYYMHSFSEKWKAGLGINAPYGLATEYDDGWVGRYHALKSEVKTININPSMAYKLNDQWSFGLGLSFQHAEGELTNAIDYGTIIAAQTGNPATSQRLDGKGIVEADSWGFGFNLGVIFEPRKESRLGLHYRSHVDQELEGDATFETPAAAQGVAQALGLVNTTAKADVTFPETVSFSGYHAFNEKWAILADITWTKWSRLEELRIKFGSGANDSVTTYEWDDTFRFSLGGTYKPIEPLELRLGTALDQTPIPNEERRTPRVPGADRIWVTLGAGYEFSKLVKVDFAYAHLFVDDPKINKKAEGEDMFRGALVGQYDASVDIISAAVSFRF